MEAFDVAIFPRAAWGDVDRLDGGFPKPVLDCVGNELRSVVAAQMLWCSVAGNSRFQDGDDIHSPDRPRRTHRHTLARILVENRQNPEPAAVLGLVFDKVPTPDLPRPLGPGPLLGRGSCPLHASLLLAHLDAFLSPDTSHQLRVDLKTLTPQQRRDAPIAAARRFADRLTIF